MYNARWAAAVVVVLGIAMTVFFFESPLPTVERSKPSSPEPVEGACALQEDELVRLWRGIDARRSEDIIVVPREPNYFGSFQITSHTGPWDYVQEIPLVLYGPGHIHSGVESDSPAALIDVYPTMGELLGVPLPKRAGDALTESLVDEAESKPALVVVIMWDGVGLNVLERWPDSWPNLRRLALEGTSYSNATVGSSPSITPASHSTLGTGVWPRGHRVTAIRMRLRGEPGRSFRALDPRVLATTTFADDIDQAFNNRSRVGLVGWQTWHLGMLGHGSAIARGDKDVVAIIRKNGRIEGNVDYYATPKYLSSTARHLDRRVDQVDRADGAADGRWLGHDVADKQTPAWVNYETDVVMTLLRRGGFGSDAVPDMLLANFKMTDVVGHLYSMDSQEMREVLAAQDEALGRIVQSLESTGKDFVVVVSADHGHTPRPESTGAWPISQSELIADLDDKFRAPDGETFVSDSHAAGFFLNRPLLRRTGTDPGAIARWLNGYTLGDNVAGRVPSGYEERTDERLLAAAFEKTDMDDVMRCALGVVRPPRGLDV
jgi:type I phosphodiesterase/nucleotide pyrophosphatase